MTVCGLGVEICDKRVILHSDGDIQEVDLVVRKFRCEFNGSVERIEVVKEGVKAVFFSGPDEKYIVYHGTSTKFKDDMGQHPTSVLQA